MKLWVTYLGRFIYKCWTTFRDCGWSTSQLRYQLSSYHLFWHEEHSYETLTCPVALPHSHHLANERWSQFGGNITIWYCVKCQDFLKRMGLCIKTWKIDFVCISKLGKAWPLRLKLFIIYVWVVHLRNIADKKLPTESAASLSRHIKQPSCVLTTSIFLSFLCQVGPDSPDWRELLALLQTVCQLQCRVHGGKWLCAWLLGWALVSWWTLSFDQHFEIHILQIEASCSLRNAISQDILT